MTPRPTSTTDSGAMEDDAQHSTARKRHGTQGKRESTPQPRPPLGHVTEKLNCVHIQADETVPGLPHSVAEAQVFAYKYMDQRLLARLARIQIRAARLMTMTLAELSKPPQS